MRVTIEEPEDTLQEAIDRFMRVMLPTMPKYARPFVVGFLTVAVAFGALWAASRIRQTTTVPGERRAAPSAAIQDVIDQADRIIAQARHTLDDDAAQGSSLN